MKVLHINRNYLGTRLHQTMIEHLDNLGVVNQVFVPVCGTEHAVIEPNMNVCVAKCFKKIDRFVFYIKQHKIIQSLEKNINVADFDVIHAYTLFTDGNVAMKLAEMYKKPFVVAVRDTDVNDFFAKLFYLRSRGIKIMRKAKKIFFLSEAYRKLVFEKYVPKKYHDFLYSKTMVIPNGIDDFWFDNQWYSERKRNDIVKLMYAGQISKRKNVHSIVESMDVLEKKGIKSTLTVVGKIVDQTEFNLIKKDRRVRYLSAMSKEDLICQYRNHDIFVMPSFTETFGLVYAEALSQGLPVVYSMGQGFDGQFQEGVVGYRCDAHDVNSVAGAIMQVISNYSEIQQNCVGIIKKFNWMDNCKKYKSIYEEIVC